MGLALANALHRLLSITVLAGDIVLDPMRPRAATLASLHWHVAYFDVRFFVDEDCGVCLSAVRGGAAWKIPPSAGGSTAGAQLASEVGSGVFLDKVNMEKGAYCE